MKRFRSIIAMTVLALAAVLLQVVASTSAHASSTPGGDDTRPAPLSQPVTHDQGISAGCSSGRCTVWLTNADTRALGAGRVPRVTLPHPVLTAAYYALAIVHVVIARSYGARGYCSAFRLSMYPWESQGYMATRC